MGITTPKNSKIRLGLQINICFCRGQNNDELLGYAIHEHNDKSYYSSYIATYSLSSSFILLTRHVHEIIVEKLIGILFESISQY